MRVEKTVFISYRRADASWALLFYEVLSRHGYDVFIDYKKLSSGSFAGEILENIRSRAHFLVVLTPSALSRSDEPGDWLRREIEEAIDCERNVVPLMLDSFDFNAPSVEEKLTGNLATLKEYNGLSVPTEHFDSAIVKLREKFLDVALDAVLHPVSETARKAVIAQKAAANAAVVRAVPTSKDQQPQALPEEERPHNIQQSIEIPDRVDSMKFPGSIHKKSLIVPLGLAIVFLPIVILTEKRAPQMVDIPGGVFMMGSVSTEFGQPVHQVTISAFELARNELTWKEWELCEEAGGCELIDRPNFLAEIGKSIQSRHPVVNVNLHQINDYLDWIEKKTGRSFRMPTEAEWEYATRAGKTTDYYWGDSIGQGLANCYRCGSDWDQISTAPVGSFEANGYRLNDMHGNVKEWVADCWHDNYDGAPIDGSAWVLDCDDSEKHVVRGGSYYDGEMILRAASRDWINPNDSLPYVGFRLARTLH